eukprot:409070-Rhodomonas_salina.1
MTEAETYRHRRRHNTQDTRYKIQDAHDTRHTTHDTQRHKQRHRHKIQKDKTDTDTHAHKERGRERERGDLCSGAGPCALGGHVGGCPAAALGHPGPGTPIRPSSVPHSA